MLLHDINLPPELEDDVKGLLKLTRDSQSGTTEKRRYSVRKGRDTLTYFETRDGYEELNGEFTTHHEETLATFDCGCVGVKEHIDGKDWVTGEIICVRCSLICAGCKKRMARYNSKEVFKKVCCKPCAKKVLLRTILLSPVMMFKEIFLCLAGITEETKPFAINLQQGLSGEPIQTQSAYQSQPFQAKAEGGFGLGTGGDRLGGGFIQ